MLDSSLFGRWLYRRRRALDLTQRQLAALAGCSVAMIRKLESDERRPSVRMAGGLARALGIAEDEAGAFVRFAREGWAEAPPEPATGLPEVPAGAAVAREGEPTGHVRPRPSSGERGKDRETGRRFVARREELAALQNGLQRALAGEPRMMLVAGEAGQGKSALLGAFAARALQRDPDLVVLTGGGNAYVGAGDPFLPFRQVLGQALGDVRAGGPDGLLDAARASRVLRLAPRARQLLLERSPHLVDVMVAPRLLEGMPGRTGGPANMLPSKAFGLPEEARRSEISAFLAGIAEDAPVVILLDDLQWIDRSSAEVLLHLGRSLRRERLLVVGAYRPADLSPSPAGQAHVLEVVIRELERRHGEVVVDLAKADGWAFLEGYLDAEPNDFDGDFRQALWRQTGGQPLLTVELLRHLEERGDLVRGPTGRWSVARAIRWDDVPARVTGALAQRLARVGPDASDVLRVASVEGSTFTAEVVAQVLEVDGGRVARHLGELARRHGLVLQGEVQVEGSRRVVRHRFRHDLIQRFVYDGIDAGERRHLHAAVAAALEALHGPDADPGVLAHHLRRGSDPVHAAGFLAKAGDRARSAGALEEAIVHYQDAADLAQEPDALWRAGLLTSLGEALWLRGRFEEAVPALTEARDTFLEAGDEQRAGIAELTLARVLYERTEHGHALKAFHRALASLEQGPESPAMARAVSCISQLHMVASEAEDAVAWGTRALAIAERVGAEDVVVHASINVGSALAFFVPERRDEGLAMMRRSFEDARRLGLVYDACRASFNLGNMHASAGDADRALEIFDELRDYAASYQLFTMEGAGRVGAWAVAWRYGRWARAFRDRPALEALVTRAGRDNFKAAAIALALIGADLDLGRVAPAGASLRTFAGALDRMVEPQHRIPYLHARLRHAVAVGDATSAEATASRLAELCTSGVPLVDLCLIGLRDVLRWWLPPERSPSRTRGVTEASLLRAAVAAVRSAGDLLGAGEGAATVFEGRAFEAAWSGAASPAAAAFEAAAKIWNDAGLPLDEAGAWRDAARWWAAGGEVDRAAHAGACADAVVDQLAAQIPDAETAAGFRRRLADPIRHGAGRP